MVLDQCKPNLAETALTTFWLKSPKMKFINDNCQVFIASALLVNLRFCFEKSHVSLSAQRKNVNEIFHSPLSEDSICLSGKSHFLNSILQESYQQKVIAMKKNHNCTAIIVLHWRAANQTLVEKSHLKLTEVIFLSILTQNSKGHWLSAILSSWELLN